MIDRVESAGVNVTKVLSTHHHPDHSAANPVLAERYGAPVFGHSSDAKRIPGFTDGLEEGDTISVGELQAEILFIPAHTRGHIAYVFPGGVFCGDTLFAAGCGRLFEGDPQMMHTALNEKLQDKMKTVQAIRSHAARDWHDATDVEMTIPSTMGEEKETNPFMRAGSPEIIANVQKQLPGTPTDEVSILGAVRRLKDSF